MDGRASLEAISQSSSLFKAKAFLSELKLEESHKNRTGKLWTQYMEMASIVRNFLRAERTGQE